MANGKLYWWVLSVTITFQLVTAGDLEAQTDGNVETIVRISPPDPDPSGIAASKHGRVFLGFPRHADNHTSFALAELIRGTLLPFPVDHRIRS